MVKKIAVSLVVLIALNSALTYAVPFFFKKPVQCKIPRSVAAQWLANTFR